MIILFKNANDIYSEKIFASDQHVALGPALELFPLGLLLLNSLATSN